MTTLVWDEAEARYYETGVSKGIFFPIDGSTGVPWNGLVAVNLDPLGGEPESYYYDGLKYMDRVLAEDFQATIQAISTPREFEPCEGVKEVQFGMKTHFNKRSKFNMAWRTEIGNAEGTAVAYKWHIAYNCLVQPASRAYQTISDTTSMDVRSFVITTTPACGRHSYYSFDSRDGDLTDLETQIMSGVLPRCWELKDLVGPIGGGGLPSDSDEGCTNLIEDLEEYNPGQVIDDDKVVGLTETVVYGLINNGLNTIELPAEGAFAANDSAASEVGTHPVLVDDDDATYITSADGDLGYTVGLPPLVGYVTGATFELHIRASITGGVNPDDPDNIDADAQVFITTDATGDLAVGGFSDGVDEGMGFALSSVDGTITDYVVPLSMDAWVDTDLADVVAALEAGAYLNVVAAGNNNFDTTPELRVYEASVLMLDSTDSGRFLRTPDPADGSKIYQHVYSSGTTDQAMPNTAWVDFKIVSVPLDTGADGFTAQILNRSGTADPQPSLFMVEMDGATPVLNWYFGNFTTDVVPVAVELNKWYTAREDWGWDSVHGCLYDRDVPSVLLLDETRTVAGPPRAFCNHDASLVGTAEVTFEVMLDNARLQVHCHDSGPDVGWTELDLSLGLARVSDGVPTSTYVAGKLEGPLATDPSIVDYPSGLTYFDGFVLPDYAVAYEFEVTFDAGQGSDFVQIWRREFDLSTYGDPEITMGLKYVSDPDPDTGYGTLAIEQIGPDSLLTIVPDLFYNSAHWTDANTAGYFALMFEWEADGILTGIRYRQL